MKSRVFLILAYFETGCTLRVTFLSIPIMTDPQNLTKQAMKMTLKKACILLGWLYSGLILAWFILDRWRGDTLWWLGLLNSFVPYLFIPLVLLVFAGLFCRSKWLWGSLIPPVLFFFGLYGELFLPALPPVSKAAGEAPFTLMTFNSWGGSRSPETARALLEDNAPDIVALQELTPQMAEVFLTEVGTIYSYHLFEPGEDYKGNGMLSRYPLTPLDSAHLDDPDWHVQIVEVTLEEEVVTFYNVHPYATNPLYYFEAGMSVPDEVRASFEHRAWLFERLLDDIERRSGPVIVTGDFNSTDQSDVYTLMRGRLHDAYRAVGWGFGHTFPAYAGSYHGIPIFPRQMRIDMIFYSDDLVALESRVGRSCGESEHLPLLARLGLR